ncbi:MAG: hypothetical protein EOL87_03900 [Spartobacteria bacterium]|nr:hypothetical protein [Spartobacteria bacterium]
MKKQIKIKSVREMEQERETYRKARNILVLYLLLPLSAMMLYLIWMGSTYHGLTSRDSIDIAQLARHISRGDGFVTSIIRPLSLWASPVVVGHPDLIHAPLYPLIEGLLFRVFGATDRIAALTSGMGWLLTVWCTYFLARNLSGGSRRGGILGVVFMLLNLRLLNLAVSGEALTWVTALVTALLWIYVRIMTHGPSYSLRTLHRMAALSGAVCGLIILCNANLTWIILPFTVVFWTRCRRLASPAVPHKTKSSIKRPQNILTSLYKQTGVRLALTCFTTAVIVMLPWWFRNAMVCGQPFYSLNSYYSMCYSAEFPGLSIFRYVIDPFGSPLIYMLFHLGDVLRSSLRSLTPLPQTLATLFNPLLFITFIILIFAGKNALQKSMKRIMTILLLLSIVLFSLISANATLFIVFSGGLSALCAAGLIQITLPQPKHHSSSTPVVPGHGIIYWSRVLYVAHKKELLLAIFVFATALPLINSRFTLRQQPRPAIPKGMQYLIDRSQTDALIMTDVPWVIAWHADRSALWLPQTKEDFAYMAEQLEIMPDWIYLQGFRSIARPAFASWWADMVRHPDENWLDYLPNESPSNRELIRRKTGEL